ncbi:hypothetical protein ABKN59_007689 [Abortiporus biennis]
MAVTRRQSGKLPPPRFSLSPVKSPATTRKRRRPSKAPEVDEEDLWMSDLTDLEDSDVEEEKQVEALPEVEMTTPSRPSKRRKVEEIMSDEVLGSSTIQTLFPGHDLHSMPLDILLEVYAYLYPVDLLNVSRTCKGLRTFLLSRTSIKVWRKARQRILPPPPDCPSDISEPHYADLLWGNSCQVCGEEGVELRTVFEFKRRFCGNCAKKLISTASGFSGKYQTYDQEVRALVPSVESCADDNRLWIEYWHPDVVRIGTKFAELQKAAHLQVECAAKAIFDKQKADWYENAQTAKNFGQECVLWMYKCQDARRRDLEDRCEKFQTIVAPYLTTRGYHPSDIKAAFSRFSPGKFASFFKQEFTKDVLDEVYEMLSPYLNEYREARHHVEHEAAINARRELLKSKFIAFTDSKRPIDSLRLFQNGRIYKHLWSWPGVSNILFAPRETEVGSDEVEPIVQQFPLILQDWKEKSVPGRSQLHALLPKSFGETSNGNLAVSTPIDSLKAVDLATAVFLCSKCSTQDRFRKVLFGYEYSVTHRHGVSNLQFSEKGSQAVVSLMQLVGLNPKTTTPFDLDALNPRFICTQCTKKASKWSTSKALNWRQCVIHFLESQHEPTWRVLTVEEADQVKSQEKPDVRDDMPFWLCNHCTPLPRAPSSINLKTKNDVLAHLLETHNIRIPVDREDYFYDPAKADSWCQRKPTWFRFVAQDLPPVSMSGSNANTNNYDNITDVAVTMDSTASQLEVQQKAPALERYVCLKCVQKRKKVAHGYSMDGLMSHMKDKHKNAEPAMGSDYEVLMS